MVSEELQLEGIEARLVGVLIEKELTTPDHYPLTLNAVVAGSNQKSNRDPVMDLGETSCRESLQRLVRKGYVGAVHPAGSRVEKYMHNTPAMLSVSVPEMAVLAELLLRGPQTPGELRARVNRMSPVPTLADLTALLTPLSERGLIGAVAPLPGSRAGRYGQCIAPDAHPGDTATAIAITSPSTAAPAEPGLAQRVEELEGVLAKLRGQFDALCSKLGETPASE